MASIVRYREGWRAYVHIDGKRSTKTFRLRTQAQAWAEQEEAKGGGKGRMTFLVASERYMKLKLPQLDNANNQRTYEQSITDHVLPEIGHLQLVSITRSKLVEVVQKLANKGKVETAHRIGQRIRAIFDHAVDCGEIDSHPAAGLSRVLPNKAKRSMPAVTTADLPELLRSIASYTEPVTRIGLQLLSHTFLRTTELIGGKWSELKGDVWVVPGERMKRRLPHVVPLSPRVRALLNELEPMTGESPYMLASVVNPLVPISNNTMLFALYRLGYRGRMTGHGFRAIASTVLNESGLWSRDAIERQLAHRETDQVREAYHRAQYLDERKRMMAWYSDYLAASSTSR